MRTSCANVENLTLTGSGNINGTGNSGNNILIGNSGANTLDGGTGADTMIGGLGNDTYEPVQIGIAAGHLLYGRRLRRPLRG